MKLREHRDEQKYDNGVTKVGDGRDANRSEYGVMFTGGHLNYPI